VPHVDEPIVPISAIPHLRGEAGSAKSLLTSLGRTETRSARVRSSSRFWSWSRLRSTFRSETAGGSPMAPAVSCRRPRSMARPASSTGSRGRSGNSARSAPKPREVTETSALLHHSIVCVLSGDHRFRAEATPSYRVLFGRRGGAGGHRHRRPNGVCQLRRLHCWLPPPLHDQRTSFVPLAVPAPVASRHNPDCTPATVPFAFTVHCWLA
jgi:hypothetical protein